MLHAYQLENHKSRHVQYTFFFILKGPVHVCEQDNCKYNRFLSSSMLTKLYLSNEMGVPCKSLKLN